MFSDMNTYQRILYRVFMTCRMEISKAGFQRGLHMRYPWPGKLSMVKGIIALLLLGGVGCGPVSTQPAGQTLPSATTAETTPATPLPDPTGEALVPAGWATHTSQRCEYAISYPAEMQVTDQNPYSQILGFKLANPEEGARNFIYVSVIVPEIQSMVRQGVYNYDVYNYDPAQTEILLSMQEGESKSVSEIQDVAAWFTYQRKPDTLISGHAAQAYENVQPWEFPGGTKEIRYYLSLDGCMYLIGGYMDTTGSNQPGAITEGLFNQIVATIQLSP